MAGRAPRGGDLVKISQQVLAGCVGLSSEVVNRQLCEWRQDGIIETPTGRTLILEPGRLEAVAEM